MFDQSRDKWAMVGQFAAWLTGIVTAFVATPARLNLAEDGAPATVRFVQFVVAVLAGLLLIAFRNRCERQHQRYWILGTIGCFLVGLAAFGSYEHLRHRWTCAQPGLPSVVIGSTYATAHAREFAARTGNSSCIVMLRDYGENWEIWEEDEIKDRYMILNALFSAIIVAWSVTVMLLLQAWRCAGVDPNKGKPSTGGGSRGEKGTSSKRTPPVHQVE